MSENFDVPTAESAEPATTVVPPTARGNRLLAARRGGFMRILPLVLAIGLAVVVSELVYELGSPSGFLFRILRVDAARVDRLVPLSIMVLFFWTMIDLALTWWHLRGEKRSLSSPIIAELPATTFKHGPMAAMDDLREAGLGRSPLMGRLQNLVERMGSMSSPELAHEAFRHESELASEQSDESYATARILVWAMPILGFIGTVLGIGMAVGEFSGFLTGDIDDVDLVKSELAKIASGLSFAFDTTLLGLLGSLIAMLAMAWVLKSDRELNAGIEALGLAIISQAKSDPVVPPAGPAIDNEVLGQVRLGLQAVAEHNTKLADSIGRLEQSSSQLAEVMGQAVPAQQALHSSTEAAARAGTAAADNVQQSVEQLREAIDVLAGRMDTSIGRVEQSSSQLAEVIGRAVPTQAALHGSAEAAAKAGTALALNVQESAEHLRGAIDVLSGRMDGVIHGNDSYESAASEFASMGRRFDQLTDMLQEVESSRQVMRELSEQLQNMESVQSASAQLISQLSKPLEFRLMPAGSNGPDTSGE